MILSCLMRRGDQVWFEDPGYPRAREALRLAGAEPVAVPVDDQGLILEEALAAAPEARFALVTPSHQAPLGMAMSLPRRLGLLEWAERGGKWIIEDDYYGEFRLDGRAIPALKSLDAAGRVLYVGTFSKVLLPSLRLGYVVVPADLAEPCRRVAEYLAPSPSPVSQTALAEMMAAGHFGRHLRLMRSLYAQRRAALVNALEGCFGGTLTLGLRDGMHLVAFLPPGEDDRRLARRAAAAGLAVAPLSPWVMRTPRPPALLMSFANIPVERAARDVARLHGALAPAGGAAG